MLFPLALKVIASATSPWMCFKQFIPTYFTIRIRLVMPKPALLVQFISIHITCFKFVWVPYCIPKDSIHKSPENTQPHKLTKKNIYRHFARYGISPWRLLSSFSLKVTASLHLKMDGCNTIVSFLGQKAYFQVQTVSFGDGHQPTSRGVYIYI